MSEHLQRPYQHLIVYIVTYLGPEPDASLTQSLSLGLVYCSCEGGPNRKLSPVPLKGILSHCRNESYPWEQNGSEVTDNLALQELVVNASLVDELGSIAQALPGVEVPQ